MGKFGKAKGNDVVEQKPAYYAYRDGKVFWGLNVRRKGQYGIEVEKGYEGSIEDIEELFKAKEAEK